MMSHKVVQQISLLILGILIGLFIWDLSMRQADRALVIRSSGCDCEDEPSQNDPAQDSHPDLND